MQPNISSSSVSPTTVAARGKNDPLVKKRIFKERATKLAQPRKTDDVDGAMLDVIQFSIGQEKYGIELDYIREIYPFRDLTWVPCTPSFVLGIVSVRGQIISVIDLREFFDLPKAELTRTAKIIILGRDKHEIGILAERMLGEKRVPMSTIQSGMAGLKDLQDNYIKGVGTDRLAILNIDQLLSDSKLVIHEEVGE